MNKATWPKTNIKGEWVILGYGRPVNDVYVGPGGHDTIFQLCTDWNEAQLEREQRGEAPRGSLQRFYIKKAA